MDLRMDETQLERELRKWKTSLKEVSRKKHREARG